VFDLFSQPVICKFVAKWKIIVFVRIPHRITYIGDKYTCCYATRRVAHIDTYFVILGADSVLMMVDTGCNKMSNKVKLPNSGYGAARVCNALGIEIENYANL
jgi:hypothetical protein